VPRLDPRSDYVFSTHDLGRRSGSSRTVETTVPAPVDLGIDVLGVPEGSPIELQLQFQAVQEGVLATGRARAPIAGECARCLGPVEDDLDVDLQELFVYPESDIEDDEADRLDGELLDLEPALRAAVVLALPFGPVCRPDCPGLCVDCGARLADDPGHRHEDGIDPRWVRLLALSDNDAGAASPSEE
jgi:uncharacterized protein